MNLFIESTKLLLIGGIVASGLSHGASAPQDVGVDVTAGATSDVHLKLPWHGKDGPLMNRAGSPWRPEHQLELDLPKLEKPIALETFLPFGEEWVQVNLEPYSIRTIDFRLLERGSDGVVRQISAPASRLYRGEIVDRFGSEVIAVIDEQGRVSATLETPDDLWYIQPLDDYVPGANGREHVLYSWRNPVASYGTCGVDEPFREVPASRSGDSTPSPLDGDARIYDPSRAGGSEGSGDPASTEGHADGGEVCSCGHAHGPSHGHSHEIAHEGRSGRELGLPGLARPTSPLPLWLPGLSLGSRPTLDRSADAGSVGESQYASLSYRAGGVAVYVDNQYYQWAGNGIGAVVNDIELLLANVSSQYDDNGVSAFRFNFSGAIFETSPGNFYSSSDASSLLCEFSTDWDASDYYGFDSEFCHLLTGRNLSGATIGLAALDVTCSTYGLAGCPGVSLTSAMGLSETNFTSNLSFRGWLTAHEFGHNLGASHLSSGLFSTCQGDSCQIMCPNVDTIGCISIGISWNQSTVPVINSGTAQACFDPAVGTFYAKASDPIPFPDGTSGLPFSSVLQALGVMEIGDTLVLFGDTYSESVLVLDQPATLRSTEGSAVIQ